MKHRLAPFLLAVLLSPAVLAQSSRGSDARPDPSHLPDLRTFLDLTDAQVEELLGLKAALQEVVRPIAEAMAQKQQQLARVLASDDPDPASLGELLIGIRTDEETIRNLRVEQREETAAVLGPEQQEKLGLLQAALVLRIAARQAVELNLISSPYD